MQVTSCLSYSKVSGKGHSMKTVFMTRLGCLRCLWFLSCRSAHYLDVSMAFDIVDYDVFIMHSETLMELVDNFSTGFLRSWTDGKSCWPLLALFGFDSNSSWCSTGFSTWAALIHFTHSWSNLIHHCYGITGPAVRWRCCTQLAILNLPNTDKCFCFLHLPVQWKYRVEFIFKSPAAESNRMQYILVPHVRHSQKLIGNRIHHDSLTGIKCRPCTSTSCIRYIC